MKHKKLTQKDINNIDWIVYRTSISNIYNDWIRRGESPDGKYFYEENYLTKNILI